jgi:HAMP domain-containing protein
VAPRDAIWNRELKGAAPTPRECDMNVLLRINLALVALFLLALAAIGIEASAMLRANARHEALREAGLMMGSALGIRAYTASEIVPLLAAPMQTSFLPQSVPSYAATQNFMTLREAHPEYAYKEATLNPTNLRDRAADWEADIIYRFRNDPKVTEASGERDTPMGRSLYLARPIVAKEECLPCHGLPNSAPQTLLERYGPNNGFGWRTGEIIGAQVVSVPFATATDRADQRFGSFIATAALTFLGLLLAVNAALYALVVGPLRRAARLADQLSRGEQPDGEFPAGGGEVAALGAAFNRMRTSLDKALKLLGS